MYFVLFARIIHSGNSIIHISKLKKYLFIFQLLVFVTVDIGPRWHIEPVNVIESGKFETV